MRPASLGLAGLLLFPAGAAQAAAWTVRGEAGPTLATRGPEAVGATGRAGLELGLGSFSALQATAGMEWTEGRGGVEAQLGPILRLDVTRWIPFADLGVGIGGPLERPGFRMRGGIGVDYAYSPDGRVGFALRARGTFRTPDAPPAFELVLRLSRRLGL